MYVCVSIEFYFAGCSGERRKRRIGAEDQWDFEVCWGGEGGLSGTLDSL